MKILVITMLLLTFHAHAKFSIEDVRIISPKKNEVTKKKVRKSFHGKKIVTEKVELISTKPTDDNPALKNYIQTIVDFFNQELFPKIKMTKKDTVLFRFQIQRRGHFDLLNIKSNKPAVHAAVDSWFMSLDKFPKIPKDSGQKELQLEFTYSVK